MHVDFSTAPPHACVVLDGVTPQLLEAHDGDDCVACDDGPTFFPESGVCVVYSGQRVDAIRGVLTSAFPGKGVIGAQIDRSFGLHMQASPVFGTSRAKLGMRYIGKLIKVLLALLLVAVVIVFTIAFMAPEGPPQPGGP